MTKDLSFLAKYIAATCSSLVSGWSIKFDELILQTTPQNLLTLVEFLRDDGRCQFHHIVSICGADYPEREKRFDAIYQFQSLTLNQRIRVKLMTDEQTAVPSIVSLFSGALWYERETYDMYGMLFTGHPDMRRLLTDYGFEGYPLRKDFPLTGFVELRYDDAQKRVVYEPVKLPQEFRDFDFLSPWEGTEYLLPGDEKSKAG